jgi:hypothetical protein
MVEFYVSQPFTLSSCDDENNRRTQVLHRCFPFENAAFCILG